MPIKPLNTKPKTPPQSIDFAPAFNGVGGRAADEATAAAPASAKRKIGRPPAQGKSTDPRYTHFNMLLMAETVLDIRQHLQRRKLRGDLPEGVADISDLTQQLLGQWYAQQRKEGALTST